MIVLPTLQRRIRGDFFRLVFLFGILGLMLMGGMLVAGRMPTLMVRLNYDSIAWGQEMETAMNALCFPEFYPEHDRNAWKERFEAAMHKAENNITEKDEPRVLEQLHRAWDQFLFANAANTAGRAATYGHLRRALSDLKIVNEEAMFRKLEHNVMIRDIVIACSACLLLAGTIWAIFMADAVSGKVSHPLRRAAEVFKDRPRLGSLLHLPPPQTLEVRILFDELQRLWSRLSELDSLNVGSMMAEKRKLEVILESADDAILVLDGREHVSHISRRMLPLVGVGENQSLGMPWRDLSSVSSNYLALREVLTPELRGKQDISLLDVDEERVFTARRRDLVAPDGRVVGHVFLLGDVTELRRRESLRSELMDWVSHELKTPMQSLSLAADMLLRRKEDYDPDSRLLVETVHADVARLRNLSRQFLDIARMTPAAFKLSLEPIDLALLLEDNLQSLRLLARESGVFLNICSEEHTHLLMLDAERFSWVISNLVSNALRASSPGDAITLRLTANDQSVLFEVADQGPGLPEAIKNRLFEPFSHGHTAGTKNGLFGLGLAITHSIVTAHGGSISHRALEPYGSLFTVTLPIPAEAYNV